MGKVKSKSGHNGRRGRKSDHGTTSEQGKGGRVRERDVVCAARVIR